MSFDGVFTMRRMIDDGTVNSSAIRAIAKVALRDSLPS